MTPNRAIAAKNPSSNIQDLDTCSARTLSNFFIFHAVSVCAIQLLVFRLLIFFRNNSMLEGHA
jgi:hypothetical protein